MPLCPRHCFNTRVAPDCRRADVGAQLRQGVDAMHVAAPAHLPGIDENVLRTQFHDDVGVRADEDARGRRLAQDGIERRA